MRKHLAGGGRRRLSRWDAAAAAALPLRYPGSLCVSPDDVISHLLDRSGSEHASMERRMPQNVNTRTWLSIPKH